MPPPLVLVFPPTDSRLPVLLDIVDDQILELNEQFQLQLSIGQSDPPTGHGLGRIQSALVQIIDNEGVLFKNMYTHATLIIMIQAITLTPIVH